MKVVTTTAELRIQLAESRRAGKSVALVPTMGCLHAGHARLIREARSLADIVVVSIYVNPLQFGPSEDFSRYPRSFDADAEICAVEGADIIFHPHNLYPEDGPKVTLTVRELGDSLCGATRPGHFDGVATVVAILFNAVQPDIAVFGEKDWQQLAIIRRMVADLHMPLEIVGVQTVREADGLAMSSRNIYLSPKERQAATILFKALTLARQLGRGGEKDAEKIRRQMTSLIQKEPLAQIDYVSIADAETLEELNLLDRPAVASLAVRIGKTRLIDNTPLE